MIRIGLGCAVVAMAVAGFSGRASAHDFWLSSQDYTLDTPQIAEFSAMVGHPEDRSDWPMISHRVVALRSFGPQGITDLQAGVPANAMTKTVATPPLSLGTHMITVETTHAVSVLEADKFNAYLDEEGLTPIKVARIANRTQDEPGHEIYSRRGKAILQVGPYTGKQDGIVTKPVGMTLEIVPTVNPYGIEAGKELPVHIYYRGALMSGVTVLLIDLDSDVGIVEKHISDKDGAATFIRPETGRWMIHAVWSAELPDTAEADFDTTFSSLSFGF